MIVYVLRKGERFRAGRPVGVFSTREAAGQPLIDLVTRESQKDMALWDRAASSTVDTGDADLDDDVNGNWDDDGDPWTSERCEAMLAAVEGGDFKALADLWYEHADEAYAISEHELDATLELE